MQGRVGVHNAHSKSGFTDRFFSYSGDCRDEDERVKKLPSRVVLGGTMKSVRMSGSPPQDICMMLKTDMISVTTLKVVEDMIKVMIKINITITVLSVVFQIS
ncbi:hypothetical protein DEO72_LG10g694 [Vigna unguiculata]|uniref:Uncharacterized protein n=1 Tax=Vigna unguiculata TaxID=3917 RepID=A0A4D6N9K2_VIGUN|nr:hypothetical protein DEO72_LG10g694 [Vigna unguiculata]